MRIGEFAKRTGLSAHTLRYYDKNGLFTPSGRSDNRYRRYSDADLQTAHFIRRARDLGFSLEQVSMFLSIRADRKAHVCDEAKSLALEKLAAVEAELARLAQAQKDLRRLADACCGGSTSAEYCSIIESLDRPSENG